MRLHISIDDVLNVWVRRWASEKGCKAYPSLQSFMRESPCTLTRYTIAELDEQSYVKIDQAVTILHNLNLEAYQVLMAVFLQYKDKKEICEAMMISFTTFDNRLRTARDFMQGAVFGSGLVRFVF